MKCIKCNNDSTVKTEDKYFCSSCFCEVIEKRFRKEIRRQEMFSRDMKKSSVDKNNSVAGNIKILIIDDNSEKAALNKYLLKEIVNDRRVKFKIKKITSFNALHEYDKNNEFDKMVIPWNIDDEVNGYIAYMLENKMISMKKDSRIIKPLIGVTTNEIILFLKIKKLSFKKNKEKDDIEIMIERLDNRYPGTKFSILKTIKKVS